MKEAEIEAHFKTFTKAFIKDFGKKPLYDDTINKACTKLLGNKFRGVFPQDKADLRPGYSVINVDTSKQKGSHWVALYITNKTCYIFDSFGRPSSTLLKILTKKLKTKGIKYKDSDRDQNQKYNSVVCGHQSMAWLLCAYIYGIRAAMKI